MNANSKIARSRKNQNFFRRSNFFGIFSKIGLNNYNQTKGIREEMKTLKTQLLLIITLFTAAFATADSRSIELRRGQTGVAIVTAEKPSPTVQFAAEELKNALKKTLDIKATICSERKQPPQISFRFLLGPTKSNPLPAGTKYDHFSIKSLDKQTLQLVGGDDKRKPLADYYLARTGTLYAVYRFMRDKLGIRMLWPGEGGVIYPHLNSIEVSNINLSDGPKLPIRTAFYNHGRRYNKASLQAAVRWGRFNGLGGTKLGYVSHASARVIGKELFKTHPEYYALINGVRKAPGAWAHWKLCHSNPDLPGLFADWGVKNPFYEDYISVGANDGWGWCECAACKALDGGQVSRFTNSGEKICFSGRMFTLANRVSAELRRRNSSKEVSIYAYSFYVDPPAHINKLDEKVIVFVCKAISWYLVPSDAAKFDELMKLWSKKTGKVVLRDYLDASSRGMSIYPYPHLVGRIIKNLNHTFTNFQGVASCGDDCRAHALSGPTQYVWAHLTWNPDEPLEKILDEYYSAGWPKSQKYIRAYYDYFEKRSAQIKKNGGNHYPENLIDSVAIMSPEAVSRGRQLLDKATKAAQNNPDELARIEFVRVGLNAAEIDCNYYRLLIRVGAVSGIPQPDNSEDMKTLLKKALKAIEKRKKFMALHRHHEGIPSAPVNYFYSTRGDTAEEKMVKELYATYSRQPAAEKISLRKGWRFSVDSPGLMERFAAPDFDDSKWVPITTEASWEKQGFGADKYPRTGGYNGWGFYRRSVKVPTTWKNGRIILILGAVDESYRLFCNGKLIAQYTYNAKNDPHGWVSERRFDLTKLLKPGEHALIAVAVHDSAGDGGIWKPASLNLERTNLLKGDCIANVVNASRQGNTLTRKQGASIIRFSKLLTWLKPGKYHVRLRFTPHDKQYPSKEPARLCVNIRVHRNQRNQDKTKIQWEQAGNVGVKRNSLHPGELQTLEMIVTVLPPQGDIYVIVYLNFERVDIDSLEIVRL